MKIYLKFLFANFSAEDFFGISTCYYSVSKFLLVSRFSEKLMIRFWEELITDAQTDRQMYGHAWIHMTSSSGGSKKYLFCMYAIWKLNQYLIRTVTSVHSMRTLMITSFKKHQNHIFLVNLALFIANCANQCFSNISGSVSF